MDREELPVNRTEDSGLRTESGIQRSPQHSALSTRDSMIDLTPSESGYYQYWKRVEKDRFS